MLEWAVLAHGIVGREDLPLAPKYSEQSGQVTFAEAFDIAVTIWRVVGGFILAAIVAVPLGILMGAYKPVEAFFEPFVSFAR